jgi:hypothetical protein
MLQVTGMQMANPNLPSLTALENGEREAIEKLPWENAPEVVDDLYTRAIS